MAGRFIAPSEQYFDNSGNILAGGKLFFYDSGTVVAKDTFSDPGGTIPNSNPVILDGAGRTPDIYLTGSYKLIIKDSADVQIETRDPVLAADDTTKGFAVWNAVTVFSELDIVRAANNFLYRSLADSNQNFEPSATAAKWSQVQLLGSYNANETYVTGNVAVDSTGNIYKSRVDSNTGNTPATSPTEWATSIPAVFGTLTADVINETTSGSGVTIEGVLVKDGGVNGTLGATNPSTIVGTTLDITGAFTAGTAAWAIGTDQIVKDTAGNVGIGVTPTGPGAYNKWLHLHATEGQGSLIHLTDTVTGTSATDGGTIAQYGAFLVISNQESGDMLFYNNGAEAMRIDDSRNLLAGADNTQTLGSASKRWSTVYAGTGTINTSDAREKTEVRKLTPAEIRASILISKEIGVYQWLDSVEEKGDSARQHVGLTVQSVIAIMEAEGLNPMSYGFICYDEWDDAFVEHPAVEFAAAVYDGDELVTSEVQAVDAWTEQTKVAGNRYGFRSSQLNTFIAAGFNARLDAAGI